MESLIISLCLMFSPFDEYAAAKHVDDMNAELVSSIVVGINNDCDTIYCFKPNELMLWCADSLGIQGSRHDLYLKYFFNRADLKNKSVFIGVDKDCILQLFGRPNLIRSKGQDVLFTYYVSWENYQTSNKFQGVALEITITQAKVSRFAFFIS